MFRIFPTPGGPKFFARRGMPDVAGFKREAAAGVYLGARSRTREDPKWLAWARREWLWSYGAWLAHRPTAELSDAGSLLTSLLSGFPPYGHSRNVLPGPLQKALWGRTSSDIPAWIATLTILLLLSLALARRRAFSPIAAAVIAASLLRYLVGYFFGETELPRISVPPAASLRIGFVLLGMTALDALLRRRAPRASLTTAGGG